MVVLCSLIFFSFRTILDLQKNYEGITKFPYVTRRANFPFLLDPLGQIEFKKHLWLSLHFDGSSLCTEWFCLPSLQFIFNCYFSFSVTRWINQWRLFVATWLHLNLWIFLFQLYNIGSALIWKFYFFPLGLNSFLVTTRRYAEEILLRVQREWDANSKWWENQANILIKLTETTCNWISEKRVLCLHLDFELWGKLYPWRL